MLALCLGTLATAEDDDRDDGLIGGAVQPRPRYEVPADPRAVSTVVSTKHRPFAKQLAACGIILPAEDVVEDEFLRRVGRVVAEMFAPGEGIDANRQAEVIAKLHAYGAMLPVPRTEQSLERLFESDGEALERLRARYSICDIIMEEVPDRQKVMEVVEHLLHAITDVGLHHAYPGEWGLSRDSALWAATTRAIEEGHYDVGGYDDLGDAPQEVADRVLMQEFAYWFITTAWNLQVPYGPREDEWTIRTPDELRAAFPKFFQIWRRTGGRVLRAPSREALQAIGPARGGG